MIEKVLINEIVKSIPELAGQTYPTNAPKEAKRPYLVYFRQRTNHERTLDGYTGAVGAVYMFSIMAADYSGMTVLRERICEVLRLIPGRKIGGYTIGDLSLDDVTETYEYELRVHRGIIVFTIYY